VHLKKEHNSLTWIHEIDLNGVYKTFGGLMNLLLDCALDKLNEKMSLYDYSNGQPANTLPQGRALTMRLLMLPRLYMVNKLHSSRPRFPTILKFN
jgi:hypothetical protein